MNQNNKKNSRPDGGKNSNWRGLLSLISWALLLTIIVSYATNYMNSAGRRASSVELEYGDFQQMVIAGDVQSVDFDNEEDILIVTPVDGYTHTAQDGTVYTKGTDEKGNPVYTSDKMGSAPVSLQLFTVKVQSNDAIVTFLNEHGVYDINEDYKAPMGIMMMLLINMAPFFIIMAVMLLIMNIAAKKGGMGGIGGIGGVGKANAKVYMEKSTGVTFADVAGQDEAKESLTEIIDFLHNPGKYTEIGAKLPKGALLVGPPGTGKTLLAKAVAGEANVPFFSISGSDFVEMFVGVGASRVRDLFKEASKVAPCIVFIDEIDTIGKSRDNRMGGNDEREQTLNQLLAEMDGFDPTKGIILLAATNRPEVLDQALLRPGRFDRRIIIDRPNLAGRLATLQVHTRNIKLAEDVNLKKVALATAGCVGADLANLVNEAALRAVRKGRKLVTQEDLLAAFELVIAGTEKKGSVLTEFEKKLVAYHEVGHAMVAYKQKNSEPVQKITIVPHTQGALGYTLLMPEEDKTELRTRDELMAKITVSMGGRAAEEVVMNTMTNGASQDIQDATQVARNMVAMFGMSDEFGMMALASRRNQYLDGGYGMDCAQDTAARMDQAVKEILDKCYQSAVDILKENREDMDKVVAYLLEKETITGAEMVAIIEGRDPELVEDAYASTRAREEKGFRPSQPAVIEAPAKKVHMISQKIEAPEAPAEDSEKPAGETPEKPADESAEEPK
ncbi:ATP-dependent zinc metalloprotease FtsH [Oscillibacter valericigenes]|uniref:ATP-dependent zinc metalloprotease FtsH n=1 Tax=Oscillibacter valericigenes TaxID=351091 RepID=UPI001F22F3B7|nr:ATP-dependent zinc metalloprotease FtsH [Oscillibacter valericigenes]MCF2664534.1 ATP-dependent zinc metalloprotease FtsH [Oscillibacter valericigenes]